MMTTRAALIGLCALLAAGCNNNSEELQKQLAQAEKERASLQQSVAERDKYFEDVMHSVNDVYADLEKARAKESQIKQAATVPEGPVQYTNSQAREKMLQNINDIGASLKANRKRIADLQLRMKQFHGQIAGLNGLIENLKASLQEREKSISELQVKVQGLEATMAEKTKLIEEKENLIAEQQKTMNTAFYVIGTRDELKKRGIIADEGGFLWGLLGSTTIMASGIDRSNFTPIDKSKDQTIQIQGRIEEILPRRNGDLFAATEKGEGHSELNITRPAMFWQDNYLVIVTD